MEVKDAIMTRRTIRRFSERQIKDEELDMILEAGLYAPSAGGRQGTVFVVSQDREVNEKLGRIKRRNSNPRMSTATRYVSREQPSIADDATIRDAFYGAPTVITLFGPKGFIFSPDDAAAAAENMMLRAWDLGIGSCYIGEGDPAFDDPYGQEILKKWGIREDQYAVAQVLFGYPREGDKHPTPKARKDGRVIRV